MRHGEGDSAGPSPGLRPRLLACFRGSAGAFPQPLLCVAPGVPRVFPSAASEVFQSQAFFAPLKITENTKELFHVNSVRIM